MSSVAERLAEIEARIQAACASAGRPRSEVRLLGASKTHPVPSLERAYAAGVHLMGESRGQELRDKSAALTHLPELEWHFIGHLQKNKVKYIVGTATMVHAVHDVAIARALGKRVHHQRTLDPELPDLQVLVEVNLADEPSKSGVSPDGALALCREVNAVDGVALRGLMAIPPWNPDPQETVPWFRQLAALAEAGQAEGLPLHELSMGMSSDFEVAIACGATLIRVGTQLFGERGA